MLVHSSYDASTIYYHPMELNYDTKRRTIILEYAIGINPLEEKRHKGTSINYVRNESRGGLAEKLISVPLTKKEHKIQKFVDVIYGWTPSSTCPPATTSPSPASR